MDWLPNSQNSISDEEKRFLEGLAQADPTSPALLRLAQEHLLQKHPDLAVQIARPVAEAHPYFMDATLVLARALAEEGRAGEAEQALNRPTADMNRLAEWLRYAAEVWERIGNTEKSKCALSAAHALQAEPDAEYPSEVSVGEAVPTITLARLYMEQGYTDRAIAVCRQILNKAPDHQQAQELLAQLTGAEEDADIPQDLSVESTETPTDYSAISEQKKAQLLAEDTGEDISRPGEATDYSAVVALAEEEEILAAEAAEADFPEELDIPEEKVATDYSAVEAAGNHHDLEDLDVPEEAALTDYTAIHAMQEEEEIEEDFTLPEPEDGEVETEDLEGLDVPVESVTTDYSAVEAMDEQDDLEGLEIPEEAALTDYSAIHALDEDEEALPEPEADVEEDFSLPEPEDDLDEDFTLPEPEDEDLETMDVQEETVATDLDKVEIAGDEQAVESLGTAEETPPEPEIDSDEEWSLPEPEDGEIDLEALESLEPPEETVTTDHDAIETAVDEQAVDSLGTAEETPPEPEIDSDEEWSLPEPEDGEIDMEALESLEPVEEVAASEHSTPETDLEEENITVPEDMEWQLEEGLQDEPDSGQDWDSDQLQPPAEAAEGATDYDSIEDLDDVLDEGKPDGEHDAAMARKRKLAERLEKMRATAARLRQDVEDKPQ